MGSSTLRSARGALRIWPRDDYYAACPMAQIDVPVARSVARPSGRLPIPSFLLSKQLVGTLGLLCPMSYASFARSVPESVGGSLERNGDPGAKHRATSPARGHATQQRYQSLEELPLSGVSPEGDGRRGGNGDRWGACGTGEPVLASGLAVGDRGPGERGSRDLILRHGGSERPVFRRGVALLLGRYDRLRGARPRRPCAEMAPRRCS